MPPDLESTAEQVFGVLGFAFGSVHFFEDTHGAQEEGLAVPGQPGFAFRPLEEPLAQLILQFLNLLTDRGLGDVALLGGAGEVSRARHGYNVAELMYFHRQILS